ncbi:MFS transporter [Streptomyces sp. XM4193]|uniref:MFS transporter n=1 Tax=Streptomyces sp. XM4193 TaxID=2929782 RepID=UPI001FFA6D3D|nr:MFS transporter [Streptomyces sp. XM4193]MCK1794758.1 MFS transporter [Streptomyces sp. XM4193]
MTAPATARDDTSSTRGHPRRWIILAVICLTQFAVIVDNTILNVAIPTLGTELDASTADIQWVINAYALVQAGLLLLAGNTADRVGRKKMLLTGLAIFGAASLCAAMSQSAGQLIAARAAMGVGGALLVTTTLAVVVQIFDDRERVRAIGIWSSVLSLGFALGPLVGGFLLDHYWWGSLFLINVPVVAIGLWAVARLVPESRNPAGEAPDPLGAVLSVVGMTTIVYAIIAGPEHGWSSPQVLVPALVGAVVMAAFALWELRAPSPMLDMHFFRNQRFVGAVAGGLLVAFGMAGSLYLLTQHLQFVLGHSPLEAGLRMAPMALTVIVVNFGGGGAKAVQRLGTPLTVLLGMGLLSGGLVAVSVLGDSAPTLTAGLVLMGAGVGFAMPTMANALMSSIPPAKAGVGAGVNGTLAEFGHGLGVAVLGAVLSSRFVALLPAGAAGAGSLTAALDTTRTEAEAAAVLDAFDSGVGTSQLVGAAAVLAGGVVAWALLRRAEATAAAEADAAVAGAETEAETGGTADATRGAAPAEPDGAGREDAADGAGPDDAGDGAGPRGTGTDGPGAGVGGKGGA